MSRGIRNNANFRATIDKLKSDNEQLKEELQVERKHAKLYDSVSAQAQIAKLQDTGDMYTRKIELEKRRIEVRGHTDASVVMSAMMSRLLC